MEKRIISILLLSIFSIVVYINYNNDRFEHLWNLLYYMQYYVLVGFAITMIWILFKGSLIRILTIPIAIYYLFHFTVNVIEIFSPELKERLYTTTLINYILSISLALSLLIIPFLNKLKESIKSLIKKTTKIYIQ